MDRYSDPLMMIMYTADKLGQVRFDFAQRQCRHGQKYDQKFSQEQLCRLPWSVREPPADRTMAAPGSPLSGVLRWLIVAAGRLMW